MAKRTGRAPSFQFYFQDYMVGTMRMTFAEKGAYMDLICEQADKGHLSIQTIEDILGLDFQDLWGKIVVKFLEDENGKFYNERADIAMKKSNEYSQSRSDNRQKKKDMLTYVKDMKSYDKDILTYDKDILTYDSHMGVGAGLSFKEKEESLESEESKESKESNKAKKVVEYTEDFKRFWAICTHKRSKDLARDNWNKAIKTTTPEEIIEAMKKYNAECVKRKTQTEYIKRPSNWLREGMWKDEYKVEKQVIEFVDPNVLQTEFLEWISKEVPSHKDVVENMDDLDALKNDVELEMGTDNEIKIYNEAKRRGI